MFKFTNEKYWRNINGINVRENSNIVTAFNEEQQDGLYTIEDVSWWFQYRALLLVELLKKFFNRKELVLDVGGGNGYTTKQAMRAGFEVALMEPSSSACLNAKKRGLKNIYCGTLDEQIVIDASIDNIMLLDVLEHIEDDECFLKLIYSKLKNNGKCMITVPAFMSLWSSEDVAAGHFRRYKLQEIVRLAEKCGFDIIYSNYFMQFLYIPVLVMRVWFEKLGVIKCRNERSKEELERLTKLQFEKKSGLIDSVLQYYENRELYKCLAGEKIGFGSSIVVILEKKITKEG